MQGDRRELTGFEVSFSREVAQRVADEFNRRWGSPTRAWAVERYPNCTHPGGHYRESGHERCEASWAYGIVERRKEAGRWYGGAFTFKPWRSIGLERADLRSGAA